MTPHPTQSHVNVHRARGPHPSMFWRMMTRAAVLRRGRAATALLAMTVAAAVATAMLDLYADVQAKLRKEFRGYGANVVVVAKDGQGLSLDSFREVNSVLAGHGLAAPFAYVVARTAEGQPVVVAGTDFDEVRRLNSWWSVNRWPQNPKEALVGIRAASVVSPNSQPFDLTFQERTIHVRAAGTLHTGSAEDSRIYLPLSEFQAWTGIQPSTIEVAVSGPAEDVNKVMSELSRALPAADVRPVRQIMEGEARVLGKTRATLLAAAVLIILTSALCVLSTLMGWIFDRRRDFAIMKALGASERLIGGFFASEAAALGGVGAVIGFLLGIALADWIGRVNFNASVTPRFSVLPVVLLGSVVVALLSALLPISLLRRVEPAQILHSE